MRAIRARENLKVSKHIATDGDVEKKTQMKNFRRVLHIDIAKGKSFPKITAHGLMAEGNTHLHESVIRLPMEKSFTIALLIRTWVRVSDLTKNLFMFVISDL